ncbi:hypothetical protein [Amycolatopsis sp. NPDC059657]
MSCENQQRRARAGVPVETRFATKSRQAAKMIIRVLDADIAVG